MRSLRFTILVAPKSMQHGNAPIIVRGRFHGMSSTKEKKMYVDRIIQESKPYEPEIPLNGPLRCDYTFYIDNPKGHIGWCTHKPDFDNLIKGTQDAMSKCSFWKNDKDIVLSTIQKIWAEPDLFPRIEIYIEELAPLTQPKHEPIRKPISKPILNKPPQRL